jgi:hypothetical protein
MLFRSDAKIAVQNKDIHYYWTANMDVSLSAKPIYCVGELQEL